MLDFTDSDREEINSAYKRILFNLKDYLQRFNLSNEIDYSKIIIRMLHTGYFSMNSMIQIENNYDYLALPPTISQGIQVMYGICCCRHVSEFLYDLLCILRFNPTLVYFWTEDTIGSWRRINPAMEKANHVAVLINNNDGEYIVDPVNRFIVKIESEDLKSIDIKSIEDITPYQDSNIDVVGKVLTKYYKYKELGIESVYEY